MGKIFVGCLPSIVRVNIRCQCQSLTNIVWVEIMNDLEAQDGKVKLKPFIDFDIRNIWRNKLNFVTGRLELPDSVGSSR